MKLASAKVNYKDNTTIELFIYGNASDDIYFDMDITIKGFSTFNIPNVIPQFDTSFGTVGELLKTCADKLTGETLQKANFPWHRVPSDMVPNRAAFDTLASRAFASLVQAINDSGLNLDTPAFALFA